MPLINKTLRFLACACLILVSGSQSVFATHLMGGELTYQHSGSQNGYSYYDVTLIVYRYCDSTIVTAPLDATMNLGIYTADPVAGASSLNWYATEFLNLYNSSFISSNPTTNGCNFSSSACIERGEYNVTLILPDTTSEFHLFVERCCRNGNIVNLTGPGQAGMTFYCVIPAGIVNSTPQITDISVPYVCVGDTITIINNAYDPDGDSLAYSFVVPFNGYSSSSIPIPDPMVDNNPYLMPIVPVTFASGYAFPNFLSGTGFSSIDPVTGLTSYYFPNQGFYVAAIEIREYRNGQLISSIRRDIQFIAIACTPNTIPNFAAGSGGNSFTIPEGQTLCFDITFNDADGDSLFLTPSGFLLDSTLVNPPGMVPPANGSGTVTTTFCWTPQCGMARQAPYQFSVSVSDNGCPVKTTNMIFSITVTSGPTSQFPTVQVNQTSGNIICQGATATFTAVPTLSGTAPQFTWFVNGVVSATGSAATFTPPVLVDGDEITVMMISNALCVLNDTAISPPFIVSVSNQPAAQVNITSNPSTHLCPMQICLFTANFQYGGSNPSFQWVINGANANVNASQFTASNTAGLMTVFVTLTPSTGCPPQNSDTIVFNIQPWLYPEVTIASNPADSLCPAGILQMSAVAANLGLPPQFEWYYNNAPLNHPFDTLTVTTVANGDTYKVSATSAYECLSPAFAYSDPHVVHFYEPLSVQLLGSPLEFCQGIPVSFELEVSGGNAASHAFSWNLWPEILSSVTVFPQASGTAVATVEDACFGSTSDSLNFLVHPLPEAGFTFTPEHPSVYLPQVKFTDQSSGAASWLWDLGEGLPTDAQHPVHEYNHGGEYRISQIAYTSYGCSDTAAQMLLVDEFVIGYIPNAFTPNHDGKNDTFGVEGAATGGYSLKIFNRWGQLIYSADDGYKRWNGNGLDGKPAPAGVYSYLVVLKNDKSAKPVTGTFTLVR